MIAVFSYNDSFHKYLTSVLHIEKPALSQETGDSTENFFSSIDEIKKVKVLLEANVKNEEQKSENLLNFEITNEPEKAYANPGEAGKEIMKFSIKTNVGETILQKLNFKINGVDPKKIIKAYLKYGEEIIGETIPSEEYLNFDYLNLEIGKEPGENLSLVLDLSNELKTGERIRIDFEYPQNLKGKYLTISKRRDF